MQRIYLCQNLQDLQLLLQSILGDVAGSIDIHNAEQFKRQLMQQFK